MLVSRHGLTALASSLGYAKVVLGTTTSLVAAITLYVAHNDVQTGPPICTTSPSSASGRTFPLCDRQLLAVSTFCPEMACGDWPVPATSPRECWDLVGQGERQTRLTRR